LLEISLARGQSLWTMLAVALAAILLTGVFYRRAFGQLPAGQWRLLLILRSLAIVVVVLLLFEPTMRYYRDLRRKPGVVFVLDRSASMSISDDPTGVTRFNLARRQLESWWGKLADDFELRLVEFAQRARPAEGIEELPTLRPDGQATSLSRGLETAAGCLPRADLEAAILLSDGVHNAAQSPLEAASQLGVVIYTVGVGAGLRSDMSYRDVQVAGLDCPDRMVLNNLARISAMIEGVGLAGRVVKVVLEQDDQPLEEKELTLDDIEGSQEVLFEFRPTAKGRHTYTVRTPQTADERIAENNQRSAVATVVEPGIRVLYIEGTLRAEYGALVDRFLAKDPDLEFCALVQTRPNKFLKRSNMPALELTTIPADAESIGQFDVFIIGDLDASYLRPEQQQLFVERVRQGAGLVMLGGYHSLGPGGYGGSPLGRVLPVEPGDREIGQMTDSFLPVLTPEGVHHPIFANIADFFPTRQAGPKRGGLPLLEGCTRVEGAQPGATVLAATGPAEDAMPVLAVQPLDRGRIAVFCGDTTRNWQQGPKALDQESPFLQFWGQMVRWLAGRSQAVEAAASITGSTDKAAYEPDEPVRLSAVVRDQEGEGATNVQVTADITEPSGRPDRLTLSAAPGPGGHYQAEYQPRVPGTYKVVLRTTVEDQELASEELVFEVGRPNLEFEKLDLDEKLLMGIAERSGGRYVHISTADHLIDQLDRTQRKKRIYLERRLYWPPLFWAVFVTLLSTEWILRRRFQLR